MKTLSMLMMAAFTLISIHSFGQHKDGKDSTQQKQLYSCPMKCEGDKTYDKPGNCPKCGMALKEQKDDHSDHRH